MSRSFGCTPLGIFSQSPETKRRETMSKNCALTIWGHSYGEGISEVRATIMRRDGTNPQARPSGRGFEDSRIMQHLRRPTEEFNNAPAIYEFFMLLSLCHTCIPEQVGANKVTYKASSPDEEAFVKAASKMGFMFYRRSPEHVTVQVDDGQNARDEVFRILATCDFDSRKRSSVLTECPDGTIKLWCKGADQTMEPLLRPECKPLWNTTCNHLCEFAEEGLRTLVLGSRVVSREEYEQWLPQYEMAKNAIHNRARELRAAYDMIEKDLHLVGATAIEDKLQEGAPEAIEDLRKAGIKIWVLTGDKQETAINIGFACNLITPHSKRKIIEGPGRLSEDTIVKRLQNLHRKYGRTGEKDDLALIIENRAMSLLLRRCEKELLEFTQQCRVVVCYRSTPDEKRKVVELIKNNTNALTLAIGDGNNDVPMIRAAHVGVGISGQEGLQAVMSADYAIAQFRFLRRLLLIHGHWSYFRLCKVVLYSFYKNIAFCFTLFWFCWFAGFSGQTIYESFYISTYNALWTLLPIIAHGLADKDVTQNRIFNHPQVYFLGPQKAAMNPRLFILWIIDGLCCSAIIFFTAYLGYGDHVMPDGQVQGLWSMGNAMYAAALIVVTAKVTLEHNTVTVIHVIFNIASVVGWFAFAMIWCSILSINPDMYFTFWANLASARFWLYIVLTTGLCILPPYILKYIKRQVRPLINDVIREKRDTAATQVDVEAVNTIIHQQYQFLDPTLITPHKTSMATSRHTGYAFSKEDDS
eukprot:gnl/Trimastix_PCT/2288.p1 GENE.gnl/Trimastix_PCT/2288~~gnl/Trimastix_PCT/2288.p1  ORF type:complete len:753 (+),score=286.68 gnl/Trimastix_PCT/2288:1391-3649(+)